MKRLDLSKKKREFTPSAGAAPKHYRQIQDGDSPLLDRRYASRPTPVAAPIEIYHPVFAYFLGQCARDDIDPPPELVSHTMKFMYSVSEIATLENARAATTRKALTDLLEYAVGQDVNPDKTSADHSVTYTRRVIPIGNALLVVVEEKSELGQGGEGCVQGALSYHVYWAQSTGDLKTSCICPSFIISLAGPFMAICGAIWTSDVIVQHLTDYIWMGRSGNIEQDHVLRVARIFYALNRAIHRLAQYYANLEPSLCNDERQRFFPLATSYLDDNNKSVSFRYTAFLKEQDPSCLTFLATLEGNEKKVVVKFVERYGEKEHRLLASHGYAPQLLYYGNIWDETEHGSEEDEPFINPNAGCGSRRMVVMEYVEGEMLTDSSVPRSLVCKALYEVIGILHQDQSVHGDVRSPNILLTEVDDDDDEGDVKERIRVIDFDWAGQENTVRYPYGLSEEIRWPEGVREHAFILKEHDLKMIKAMEWVA
ncbi:hypothetical protein K474DRAFT_1669538 [Panus rudis PR-1116 ss-1]|nr:hypothetical protein K474DRAFT_1669538 [Panus rudis PR-1116 ss-1]